MTKRINGYFFAIITLVLAKSIMCFYTYQPHLVIWDACTYIAIGKSLFSQGAIGMLEPFRPLMWSIVIGSIWKIGIDPFIGGNILQIVLSGLNCIFIFLIGRKVYNEKVGFIAAFLLIFSPATIFFGNYLLTEIPAVFLCLVSILLWLNKRYFLSGVFSGMAFFTKFPFLIVIGLVILIEFISQFRSKKFGPVIQYAVGSLIVMVVFAVLHYVLYRNILAPFVASQDVYPWHQDILLTVRCLLFWESFAFIFVPLGLIGRIANGYTKEHILIAAIGMALFGVIAMMLPTDIWRLAVFFLPFLYLFAARGVVLCYNFLNHWVKKCIFILVCMSFMLLQFNVLKNLPPQSTPETVIQRYVRENMAEIKEARLWFSNPLMFAFADVKIDEVLYNFNSKFANHLRSKFDLVDYIFIDSRDVHCWLEDKEKCEREKLVFFKELEMKFIAELMVVSKKTGHFIAVFRRTK